MRHRSELAARSSRLPASAQRWKEVDLAPPEVALRAVELDLMERVSVRHSILRPAWFMQNFSETFLKPIDGAITVPTGDGAEAFVDAEDIAAVAAATLADPSAHAGAQYSSRARIG